MDRAQDEIPSQVDHRSFARPGAQQGRSYDEDQKALGLSIFAETGSLQTVEDETGIPRNTVRYWIESDPKIDATLDALRRVLRERMAHKYAEIAMESAKQLLDRVNNGDYKLDKEGKFVRIPIPGRELAFITSVAGDKHALLTGTMQKQRGEDQALTNLADKLVAAMERKRIEGRTVDATYPQEDAQEVGKGDSIIGDDHA